MSISLAPSDTVARFWFIAPAERLTMNQRLHWAARSKITKTWRTATEMHARNWRSNTNTRSLPPCLVRVTFGVPDRRRRDPHNTAPTVKAIVDGMVDAGLWADDTPDQVAVVDPVFVKGDTTVTVECWEMTT